MYRITVLQVGKNIDSMIQDMKIKSRNLSNEIIRIAEESRDDMSQVIEENRKRDSGPTNKPHLSELIKVTIEENSPEILRLGVGDIKFIEENHKNPDNPRDSGQGWKLLNWGGKVPANGKSVPGQFSDGPARTGGGGARFQYSRKSQYRMTPKAIVTGIHFIGRAWTNVVIKIERLMGRV